MSFDELFNPGAGYTADQKAAEAILPAPAPVAGAPLWEGDDLDVVIPDIPSSYAVLPDPPRAKSDDEGDVELDD